MAEVSIGVPARNSAAYLAESLECLRVQTFESIAVTVFDNASDDATPEIAAEFAARDPRFSLVRQPRDIGMVANFRAALDAATGHYFMWRADDDLSDPNYVETLVALLHQTPDADLAVPTVAVSHIDGANRRVYPPPAALRGRGPAVIARRLFGARASWYYGLWVRERLAERYARIARRYPHAWAHDHLTLLPSLIGNAVVGTEATTFHQRYKKTEDIANARRDPTTGEMQIQRRQFAAACRAEIDALSGLSFAERLAVRVMLPVYVDKRSHRLTKIARSAFGGRQAVSA